jgi:hypothetical protein
MNPWPKHPIIYEINTWVWLNELKARHRASLTLAAVPAGEWDLIAELGVTAVWLMGVWERSPIGIQVALNNGGLMSEFRRVLPDLRPQDIVGSPYCVRRYVVDENLGGSGGLAIARKELARRGIRLILDFVPNHVAPDHPWVFEQPEYFIRGDTGDLQRDPASFFEAGGKIFACGKDPYFPAWPDVVQFNAFHQGLRKAIIETVSGIADQCDGVRCDMAMLLMNNIFERTWGHRAGARPGEDYWTTLIPAVRARHPEFLFLAEAYWDLEWELQRQGFDFCYDKRLYDRLEHENAESVRLHLCADIAYQKKLVRFIENHDEPRAASTFSPEKERAAAITTSTLQGAKLFHEGQFEGRKVKLPVFLGRRPDESVSPDLRAFYDKLLKAIHTPAFRDGEWHLCDRSGWPDNQNHLNLVAWCWKKEEERFLIGVNLSEQRSQARIRLPWDELTGKPWRLFDVFSGEVFERDGGEMRDPGFYVDLPAWGYHFFRFKPIQDGLQRKAVCASGETS